MARQTRSSSNANEQYRIVTLQVDLFECPLRVGSTIPKLAMPMHRRLGTKPTVCVGLNRLGHHQRLGDLGHVLRRMPGIGLLQDTILSRSNRSLRQHRTGPHDFQWEQNPQKRWKPTRFCHLQDSVDPTQVRHFAPKSCGEYSDPPCSENPTA